MNLRDAMTRRPQAPMCSVCGHEEVQCSPQAVAVVCSTCTARAAETYTAVKPSRPCPDCGKELPIYAHRCPACAKKRSRENARERIRRHRQTNREQV